MDDLTVNLDADMMQRTQISSNPSEKYANVSWEEVLLGNCVYEE